MITYKTQFDKLTRAYINGEVDPYKSCACFVGNLLGGSAWEDCRINFGKIISQENEKKYTSLQFINLMSNGFYSAQDIVDMEREFLFVIAKNTVGLESIGSEFSLGFAGPKINHPNYENALFLAF